jgi:hypothetical protein
MDERGRLEREEVMQELEERRRGRELHRADIEEFVHQCATLRVWEGPRGGRARGDVDERLCRAVHEQRARDARKAQVAVAIGRQISRQPRECDEYEQLCVDLTVEEEMEKLRKREIAHAEKVRRQYEEVRTFMAKAEQETRERALMSKREDETLRHEQLQIRIEQYRTVLAQQLVERKQMYEAAREAELEKLQRERQRETQRQELIDEERRSSRRTSHGYGT